MENLSENASQQNFFWEETTQLLEEQLQQQSFTVDEKRKHFISEDQQCLFYPPFCLPILPQQTPEEYLQNLPDELGTYLVLLIQAGAASLGIWQNDEFVEHKVITKYMVRKKQGKAQITYLNTKGKSRAGSRLRLQNTVNFFRDINAKLSDWEEYLEECQELWYSCPVRLWTEVFASKEKSPLTKDDQRWRKIPLDVRVPNHTEMCRVFRTLCHGKIIYKTSGKEL